jgi:pilus assembly protein CpaE
MSRDEPVGAAGNIRVLIIPGLDPVGDWVASVIQSEHDMVMLGLARNVSTALETIERLEPDVILVDVGSGILEQPQILDHIGAPMSGYAVIIVAMMGEVDLVRRAMLHGAQGFLLKPFDEAELLQSVRQAYDLVVRRRAEFAEVPRLMPGAEEEQGEPSTVVGVFSPKGGVGCTLLAVNLAVAIRDASGKPTVLVDGDLRFGDVDTALNIASKTSIATLLPQIDGLDDALFRRSLVQHNTGIQVLPAPSHLDGADTIRPEKLGQLLLRMSRMGGGYVVVDTWSALNDLTLAVLDASDDLVIATSPEVTALRGVHRFLEALNLLNYDLDHTWIVLNHCYQRSEIKLPEVERALGRPIAQTIGYAPGPVLDSLNRGVPLVRAHPDSRAAQSIVALAHRLVGTDDQAERVVEEPEPAPPGRARKRRRFFRGRDDGRKEKSR